MRNPNPKRPNKNTLYLAMSGAGKSQALKQNPDLPKPGSGALMLLFDPNHDHQCSRVRGSIHQFAQTVAQAIQVHETQKRGARLAWDVNPSPENFEQFCRVVNACLDGKRETFVIAEELSLYNVSAGKAPPEALRMINTGRKFGLVFHGTTQRPTEIPKTYYGNCDYQYIGRQKTMAGCKAMAAEIDVDPRTLKTLPDLHFYLDKPGQMEPQLIELQYQE